MNHHSRVARARERQEIMLGWIEVSIRLVSALAAIGIIIYFAATKQDPTLNWLGVVAVLLGAQELARQTGKVMRNGNDTGKEMVGPRATRHHSREILDSLPGDGPDSSRVRLLHITP